MAFFTTQLRDNKALFDGTCFSVVVNQILKNYLVKK